MKKTSHPLSEWLVLLLYISWEHVGTYPKYFIRILALPESRSFAMLFSRI